MAEIDTAEYERQVDADKRLNKNEKKARKALAKLGLKPVPNVKAVTMKKAPSILFLFGSPEVFKSPAGGGQETYIVYGECQIDDGTQRRMPQFTPSSFSQASEQGEGAGEAEEPSSESGDVSAEGLQEKDIEMVMSQANVDRKKAISALKKNGGDIVNSIMDLTM